MSVPVNTTPQLTFGHWLFVAMLLYFGVNAFAEKSSVGKWWFGRKQELYPMSTFSVFLQPRLSGAQTYGFTLRRPGHPAQHLSFFSMFAPLTRLDLEDEITFQQLTHLEESIVEGCPTYQPFGHSHCLADKPFVLPSDLQAMWQRSVTRLGFKPPFNLTYERLRWDFPLADMTQVSGPRRTPIITYQVTEGGQWRRM